MYATQAKAFDAAIDAVARLGIPVAHTDRASGLIDLGLSRVAADDALRIADCGRVDDTRIVADIAAIRVVVRDDGGLASVLATAHYQVSRARNATPPHCESTGALETDIEMATKRLAESRAGNP